MSGQGAKRLHDTAARIVIAACLPRRPRISYAARPRPDASENARALHGPPPVTHRHQDRRCRDHRPRRRIARGQGRRAHRDDRRRRRAQFDAGPAARRSRAGLGPRPASRPSSTTCSTWEASSRFPGYAVGDRRARRAPRSRRRNVQRGSAAAEGIHPAGRDPRPAAIAHVARTVCRRAERSLVHLAASAPVGEPARRYLNRLSDLLFVLARVLNRSGGRKRRAVAEGPPGRRLTRPRSLPPIP